MTTINLDNLTILRTVTTVKQARVDLSGNRMGMPPVVLFHPWRLVSPALHPQSEPSSSYAALLAATSKPVKPARDAGRSGASATCGTSADPFTAHRDDARLDCQSTACIDDAANGLAGYRPRYGLGSAGSSGK